MDKETQIVDDILSDIISNKRKPGSKLPSENEIAEKYQIPRIKVRNAFLKLEERGYIYAEKGKGRFVQKKSQPIQLHLTGKISFTDKMKQLGYALKTVTTSCEKIQYEPTIYEQLQADCQEDVYCIARVRYIDDEPMAIHYSYVRERMFPTIMGDGFKIESMFAFYRNRGYSRFSSGKTLLSIVYPSLLEQQVLLCKSMVPLILVQSTCMDERTKKTLEYTKILYRSDKFQYDITIEQ